MDRQNENILMFVPHYVFVAVKKIIEKLGAKNVVCFNFQNRLKAKVYVEPAKYRGYNRIATDQYFLSSENHLLRMHSDCSVRLLF